MNTMTTTLKRMSPYLPLIILLVVALFMPAEAAWAQVNPLDDAGVKSGAIQFLENMTFWLWIVFGAGLIFWGLAYFSQGLFPQPYNAVRDWIKTAVIIAFTLPAALTFVISQANGN